MMRLTTYTGTSYRRIRPAKCACPRAAHDTGHAPAQRWPNAVGRTLVKHWSDNSPTGRTLFKTGQTLTWSDTGQTGQTLVQHWSYATAQGRRSAGPRRGVEALPPVLIGRVKFWSNSTHWSNPGQTLVKHWSNTGQTPQGKRSAGPRGRVEAPPPRLRRAGPEFDQYRTSRQPASGPCAALPRVAPTRGAKRGRPPSDPGLARV